MVVLAAIVVLGVVLALTWNKGWGILIGIATLLVVAASVVLFVGVRARAPVAAPAVPARPVAVVAGPANFKVIPVKTDAPATRVLRGRVLLGAAGETPFAGAAVQAALAEAGPSGFQAPAAAAAAGPDGKFALERVPEAAVRVRAVAEGHAAAAVEAPAGSKDDLVIRLLPAAHVSGRVLDRETRVGIPGARVSWGQSAAAITGPDGAYRLDLVPRDGADLAVRAKGYARKTHWVDLPAGGRDGVDILLRPGSSISGTVYAPDGKPCPGAILEVETLFEAPMAGEVPVPLDVDGAASKVDGTYEIDGLPAGRKLRVSARTEACLSDPVAAGPLEPAVGQEGVDIRLQPAATVVATVLDGRGSPVAGASVSVRPPTGEAGGAAASFMNVSVRSGRAEAKTDEKGVARVRPVSPGPHRVRAEKQDYRDAEVPLLAGSGVDTPATLVLDAGQSIAGRVIDGDGAALPAATVTVTRFGAGANVWEQRTTAEDGTFRVGGIDGKGFTLRAEKTGYVATSLNNQETGKDPVTVALQRGGAVFGVVTDADGAPVGKFRVLSRRAGDKPANPMDWQRFAEVQGGREFEDPAGKYRIDGLEPGTWTLEARAEGMAPGRAEGLAVVAAKEIGADIALGTGIALSGVVVRRSDGTPVEGARVKLPADGPFGEFDMGEFDLGGLEEEIGDRAQGAVNTFNGFAKAVTATGPDGRFTLKGLEAGTVRLMVSARGLSPASIRGVAVPPSEELRVELAEEAALEGTVTDAGGAPKEGAMIMVQKIPVLMRYARTDAQGRYRVGGLGAGAYLFYCMDGAGGAGFNLKSDPVTLEEGKTARKDYRMGEGTKVAGKVTRGGKPVPQVAVMLFPAARSGGGMGMLTGGGGGGFAMGSTKEDGTYEITGVNAGRYNATVQSGFGASPGGGETFDVPKGATEVRHDIVLPDTGIRGVVVDEEGKAVPGAAVMALDPAKTTGRITDVGSAMESVGGQAFTDDTGAFALGGMRAGTWSLRVQAQGFGTEVVEGVVTAEGAGAEVKVTLRRGNEVTVRVLAADGTPVRGANVFLADAEGRELTNLRQFDTVKTGEDGRAVVRVPSGTIQFEAAAPGYGPGETKASVPATEEVVVRLPKGASLKVLVTGAGGAPVAGAGVELLDATGVPFGQRFSMESFADLMGNNGTGADGRLARKDLPAGIWRVRAAHTDGRSGEEKVTLVEGETVEVTIALR
jgi:protocatechuate 3,4-dioxygenase beta subunit